MNLSTSGGAQQSPITGTYSSPISRHYRLANRDDVVPRDELPYEFVDSDKRVTSSLTRAFAPDGPATSLFAQLTDPHLFTVYGDELGIPERHRHARCIRKPEALAVWRAALRETFTGAYLFKFEVALDDDELHIHVIADERAGLPELVRGSKKCTPVYDPEGVVRYLKKPPVYSIRKRVKEYVRAKKGVGDGKLPEVSGYERLPAKAERLCRDVPLETPSQTQKTEVAESSYIYKALWPTQATSKEKIMDCPARSARMMGYSHLHVALRLAAMGVSPPKIASTIGKSSEAVTAALETLSLNRLDVAQA